MVRSYSAALPIAYVMLRILIVLNWMIGAAILVLLFVMPHEQWIMTVFKLTPSPEATRLVWGLRAVAAIGVASIPIKHLISSGCLRWWNVSAWAIRSSPRMPAPAGNRRLVTLQLLGLLVAIIRG